MKKESLPSKVLENIRGEGLFESPGLALLAVSGGPDSVALLALMSELVDELGLTIAVAHIDHGIQPETKTVVPRVQQLAESYSVPCFVEALDLGSDAGETVARRERYRALRLLQKNEHARYLVTAHHRDDQHETVLYRFLRGSGLAGLAGIPNKGPIGLVRPLLPFYREELTGWLEEHSSNTGRAFELFQDPANKDRSYDRVWIRHEVIPTLRERFGPILDDRLLDVSRQANANNAAWSSLLRVVPGLEFSNRTDFVEVARSPFDQYDKMLGVGLLRALGREVGCRLGLKRAEMLFSFLRSSSSGRTLQLGSGWKATIVFDRLRIYKERERASADFPEGAVCEGKEGNLVWGSWELSWQSQPAGESKRNSLSAWITPGTFQVRGPKPGDVVVPYGGVGRRSVRRVMMEARVPAPERDDYPLVVREGQVLWIPGVCRSAEEVPDLGEQAFCMEAKTNSA